MSELEIGNDKMESGPEDNSTIGAFKREAYEIIRELGGVRAECSFSGSGDSGFVEGVEIYGEDDKPLGTNKRLDEIADELVCLEWSGWYDGNGGEGTIEFLPDGQVRMDMNWYVEQTEPAGTVTY